MLRRYVDVVACPDCRGDLEEIRANSATSGLLCAACGLAFPVTDGIPILLPRTARNYDLEFPLIRELEALQDPAAGDSPAGVRSGLRNTLAMLESVKGNKSWEWEDEEHWSKEYQEELAARHEKQWDVRMWQMEWFMRHLLKRATLRGKSILDVGCGEGQMFRLVLSPHCDDQSLYIAADVSIHGLQLNRARNKHRNAIYVLCSADRLPFQRGIADLLCYFGILHHTERKSATIRQDSELVADGGHIIVHEATERPYLSSLLPFLQPPASEVSAHEERVKKQDLMATIRSTKGVDLVAAREAYSILFGISRYVSGIRYLNRKWFYHVLLGMDLTFVKVFGWMSPALGSGESMLLLKKTDAGQAR